MSLCRTRSNPEYKYDLGFVAYGPEETHPVVELTYNYGVDAYTLGNKYGFLALSTADLDRTAADLAARWRLTRPPGPHPGMPGVRSCATADPDGWPIVFMDAAQFDAVIKA